MDATFVWLDAKKWDNEVNTELQILTLVLIPSTL